MCLLLREQAGFTPKREETKRKPMRDCNSGKCVSVCPMGLNPAFLMRDAVFKDWETCEKDSHL